MGKKDMEIVRLNEELEQAKEERDTTQEGLKTVLATKKVERVTMQSRERDLLLQVEDFTVKNESLEKTIQQLTGDMNALNKNQNVMISEFQKKIKELQDHRQLIIQTVNISGLDGSDMDKILNDAGEVLKKRLETSGRKDVYDILSIPHTMSLGIVG